MQCPCGGNVNETNWEVRTILGLKKHELPLDIKLPVQVRLVRCRYCGRNDYTYSQPGEIE